MALQVPDINEVNGVSVYLHTNAARLFVLLWKPHKQPSNVNGPFQNQKSPDRASFKLNRYTSFSPGALRTGSLFRIFHPVAEA